MAVKNLRESLARYPTDSEARQFLEEISGEPAGSRGADSSGAVVASVPKMPLPRIKRNYDETSFRLLALEIQNSAKPSDDLGGNTRTKYHIQHGTELLDRGVITDAENEFHEALRMEPASAAAHAGLARAAEARGDVVTARSEASTSIGLQPTAAAFLIMGVGLLCARPTGGLMAYVTADDAGGTIIRRLVLPMVLKTSAPKMPFRLTKVATTTDEKNSACHSGQERKTVIRIR